MWRENAELTTYLLAQEGIQLDLLNVDGYTPLMIAVEKGSDEIFEVLLEAVERLESEEHRGWTGCGG